MGLFRWYCDLRRSDSENYLPTLLCNDVNLPSYLFEIMPYRGFEGYCYNTHDNLRIELEKFIMKLSTHVLYETDSGDRRWVFILREPLTWTQLKNQIDNLFQDHFKRYHSYIYDLSVIISTKHITSFARESDFVECLNTISQFKSTTPTLTLKDRNWHWTIADIVDITRSQFQTLTLLNLYLINDLSNIVLSFLHIDALSTSSFRFK